jgi:L-malate glycosyltransferase
MKRLLTIYMHTENVHLVKDVGMIPYILYKELNYDAAIASYKNGDYPYLRNEVRGLKQAFIKRHFNIVVIDVFLFLLRNRKRYDILHLFHLDSNSLLIGILFKLIRLGNVKVYLKIDTNDLIRNKKESRLKKRIFRFLMKRFDLLSVETTNLQKYLSDKWELDIKYIANGFYDEGNRRYVEYEKKENVILTVGRIGVYVKSNDILCEGFRQFAEKDNSWQLEIVGPVEPSFNAFIEEYFRTNPSLKERVKFIGSVTDRELLWEYYSRAKIFVLSSKWEGFPLVFLEAAKAGCYIISTEISPAYDMTDNGRLGSMFPIDDSKRLSEVLLETTKDERRLEGVCRQVQDYVYERFYWPTLCRKIDNYLNQTA